jgi:hypothetical protein
LMENQSLLGGARPFSCNLRRVPFIIKCVAHQRPDQHRKIGRKAWNSTYSSTSRTSSRQPTVR